MTHLNKKRAGDENIGKLIMFSVTIIIAVGLVGLITYFYNQSRIQSVNMSILGSTASSATDIKRVTNISGTSAADWTGCDATKITYNPITNLYTLMKDDTNVADTSAGKCDTGAVKGITVGTVAGTYTIN